MIRNWSKELAKKECSFTRATIKTFGSKMIFPFLLILFSVIFILNPTIFIIFNLYLDHYFDRNVA